MSSVLSFRDVTLKFGGITALNSINFDVNPGELYAIIGPNGAGKTSIFNCISGIYRPTEGEVTFGSSKIYQNLGLMKLQILELQEHFKILNFLKI